MPITVQHGPPVSTIAPLAYDTGRMAGQEERRRYDQKIGMQQARDAADERRYAQQMMMRQFEANADRAYRAEQSDLNRQFQLEQQDRAREMRMEEWGMKADSEKQRLRQQRTAYERQSQQIEQAMSDGLLSRTEAMQAHEELSKRFSPEVIDAFIPTPQEEEKLNRPMMKMDDGTEWPVAITKDGKPDYFETWKEYQRLSLEREKIKAGADKDMMKEREKETNEQIDFEIAQINDYRAQQSRAMKERAVSSGEKKPDMSGHDKMSRAEEIAFRKRRREELIGEQGQPGAAVAIAPSIQQMPQDQIALPQKQEPPKHVSTDLELRAADLARRIQDASSRGDAAELERLYSEYDEIMVEKNRIAGVK